MCSLAEGPPPPADGCITVCEENGDLVTIHARNAPVNYTPRIAVSKVMMLKKKWGIHVKNVNENSSILMIHVYFKV